MHPAPDQVDAGRGQNYSLAVRLKVT